MSDIDLVVVVNGEPPFSTKVIGSELDDVEVIAFTVSEFCEHYMDNNLMIEALSIGVPIIGDPRATDETVPLRARHAFNLRHLLRDLLCYQ